MATSCPGPRINYLIVTSVYQYLLNKKKKGEKQFAVLIDPEKFNPAIISESDSNGVDFFFVGGSTVNKKDFQKTVRYIKNNSATPLVLFPGDEHQISPKANALLLLTLLSGRNAEYLIGKQVKAALPLKKSGLEIISTGYIIVDNGTNASSTSKISGTKGIRFAEKKLVLSTALAGEMLGCQLIYLEGGSGAKNEIPATMIRNVNKNLNVPLIVGGGIDSAAKARKAWKAGADVIVVGNAIENDLNLIKEISILSERKNKTGGRV